MEIDTHILSLTMEFERQNIIITEWETEKAKNSRDKKWSLRKKKKPREEQQEEATGVPLPTIVIDEDGRLSPRSIQSPSDHIPPPPPPSTNENEEESGFEDNNDSGQEDSDEEEPKEVKQAWDELVIIQREQARYSDIKLDLEQDLEEWKDKQKRLENVSR